MKSKKIVYMLFTIFMIIALSMSVQAKIVLSATQEQYNLGDSINQNIKVITNEAFSGFIRANLNCDSQETLLFYSPITLEANKEKSFSFSYSVERQGKCFIYVDLEKGNSKQEEAKSSTFILTNKINIELTMNKQYFLPEETLKINGKAIMADGQSFNGMASIHVENVTYSTIVSKGFFSQQVLLSKVIAPGKQPIHVYLTDDKNNSGDVIINFEVGVVKTALELKVNKDIINPGEVLLITPALLDQAGNTIDENVSLSLIQFQDIAAGFQKRVFLIEDVVKSGKEVKYKFPDDAAPQDYHIQAESSGFTTEKIVSVPKVEKITFDLKNTTSGQALWIKNVGNVAYQKPFEFSLALEEIVINKIINLDLEVNEEQSYYLDKISNARPEGVYELKIASGDGIKTFSNVPLTGKAASIIDLEAAKKTLSYLPFILIAVLVILLIIMRRDFFFKLFQKKPKKGLKVNSVYGFEVDRGEEKTEKTISSKPLMSKETNIKPSKPEYNAPSIQPKMLMSDISKKEAKRKIEIAADNDARMFSSRTDTLQDIFDRYASSLAAGKITPTTVAGQKRDVSVLMARISNLNNLANLKNSDTFLFRELADKFFSKVMKAISQNSGVADLYENNLVIFFNAVPTANHVMSSIKTAQALIKATEEINQELSRKGQAFQLYVSAGIHTGPVVVNNIGADKTLRYSPIAGTTSIAKALERKAIKNEILISESVYKQASGLNTKRKTPVTSDAGAMNSYSVIAPEEVKKDAPYWMK